MGQTMCSEDECATTASSRGLCGMHYARRKRAGTLPDRLTTVQRFWSHVDKNGPVPDGHPELGPCWLWTGATHRKGYGQFRGPDGVVSAHVYAWQLDNGPVPEGSVLDHYVCYRPGCVRHVMPVTHQENLENRAGLNVNNRSGHRGVAWMPHQKKWLARAWSSNVCHYGGYHETAAEAGAAALALRLDLMTNNRRDRLMDATPSA